jgi:hypothetical protein
MSSVVAQSCASTDESYDQAVSRIWQHPSSVPTDAKALQRELVDQGLNKPTISGR